MFCIKSCRAVYTCFITALMAMPPGVRDELIWTVETECLPPPGDRVYPYRTTYWIFLSIQIKTLSISILYLANVYMELFMSRTGDKINRNGNAAISDPYCPQLLCLSCCMCIHSCEIPWKATEKLGANKFKSKSE